MRMSILRKIIFALVIAFLTVATVVPAHANGFATTQTNSSSANAALLSNVDTGVAQNQHTFVQALSIEFMSTLICQLAGIDILNPSQGCLGINPAYIFPSIS